MTLTIEFEHTGPRLWYVFWRGETRGSAGPFPTRKAALAYVKLVLARTNDADERC